MSNNKNFKVKNSIDLGAYNKSIDDTAVDVFVYDTSKDSDGGAWRKRTQHTSWYNETLNTSTRGSRKEFPAVAVIVAESSQVTIYDGDDPDLPMWMVFNARNYLLYPDNISSVVMRNGLLASGGNDATYYGFVEIDFISEQTTLRTASTSYGSTAPISGRNTTFPYATLGSTGTIVNVLVNDVAMTVLPNAPIDAATGLPVPTIAVATDGGVSVIKDDGTVVDITYTSSTPSDDIAFVGTEYIRFSIGYSSSGNTKYLHLNSLPTSDVNDSNGTQKGSSVAFYSTAGGTSGIDLALIPDGGSNISMTLAKDSIGTTTGLTFLDEDTTTPANGMVAYTTSSYNTGWMNGDIKLATLSDTDDTNVTGSELVTNGTFDSNINDWQARGNASNSWNSSGYIDIDRNGEPANAGKYVAYQVITGLTVGQTYTASAEVIAVSVRFNLNIGNTAFTADLAEGAEVSAAGDIATVTFTATATSVALGLGCRGSQNATASVDNVTLRLAEEDRSVNGNGLQVFGTVTKSAVATGADLVAYSGFSQSNYLFHPIDAMGIDWSTEWSVMFWSLDQGFCVSLEQQNTSSYNNTVLLLFNDASNFVTRSHNANYQVNLGSGLDGLHHIAAVYKDGRIIIYQDGVSIYDNTSNGISNLDVGLMVGARTYNGSLPYAPADQKLALLKVSGTNPSPEQIKKIYEDEKVLFQDGAQATLYGDSDAVTALAYDDSTELLHVGTSAGRSVFQGLRRVDNTEDAVGAAISASNNLIVEE